jgi:hypothetical protein
MTQDSRTRPSRRIGLLLGASHVEGASGFRELASGLEADREIFPVSSAFFCSRDHRRRVEWKEPDELEKPVSEEGGHGKGGRESW